MRQRIAEDHHRLLHYANGLEDMVSERTRALETARDDAESANRAKTLFLANVSHELRTPLQAIILHARLISGGAHCDNNRGSLDTILRSSSHLLDLIEQLLNLAKAESGETPVLAYSTFAIRDLIDEAASTIRATLSTGNQLSVQCVGEAITIVSDRTRLLQVIYNLLRNADKFTTNGHLVLMLDFAADQNHIRLTISDDGIGIPTEQLHRIFEPFFQGGTARGAVFSGIGIGLWVTKSIVDALGGRIDVSSAPGKGATFRIEIPITPSPRVAEFNVSPGSDEDGSARVPRPIPINSRVLFGEDETVIRDAMGQFLREAGYVVDACADGTAVFAMLQQDCRRYDVIVLDHRMPGYTGLAILKAMRDTLLNHTPVIILTGNDTSELREEAARYSAALIAKPVQPERLIEAIARAVDGDVAATIHPGSLMP